MAWPEVLTAMFQAIDMNNDGKKICLLLRNNRVNLSRVFKIRTFINHGSAGNTDYRYDPFMKNFFPQKT